jgi:hypothetical protein
MAERINNLSARLMMNEWLVKRGHPPIDGDASYMEFATKLRAVLAPTLKQAPFVDRASACRYVRDMARQHARFSDLA